VSIGINTEAGEKLKLFADRIERLSEEIDGLKDDLKDLKAEAKAEGFNVQALLRLVAIRRNKKRLDAESELLNDLMLYAHATGTPLDLARPAVEPGPMVGAPSAGAGAEPRLSPARETVPFE
jgi:uncharacterized protein (UPF0335 family)